MMKFQPQFLFSAKLAIFTLVLDESPRGFHSNRWHHRCTITPEFLPHPLSLQFSQLLHEGGSIKLLLIARLILWLLFAITETAYCPATDINATIAIALLP